MIPVVVFDTNILISAIGWKGTPYFCVELARQGIIESVTCKEILDELIEKLHYIVTGDKKHLLPLKNYQGIAIINAAEFRNLIS